MRKSLWAFVLVGLMLSGCNCVKVKGNEVAVIEDMKGPQENVLGPGLHFLVGVRNDDFNYPINDQTFVMGKGTKKVTGVLLRHVDERELLVKSKDGQKVWISLTLRYSLDRNKILFSCNANVNTMCGIHIEARDSYEETWIRPEVVRTVKDLVNEYSAKQVYAEKRPELNQRIEDKLAKNKDLGGKGILIKTFVLDMVRLEKGYENEITATVLQDQRRIRAEKETLAAKEEANAARAKAQAEVETRTQKAEAAKQERMKAAEAERFEREQEAVGLLAKGEAEARVEKLKRDANYAGEAGSRRMKVEMVRYQAEAAKGLFPNATNIGDPTLRQVLNQVLGNSK